MKRGITKNKIKDKTKLINYRILRIFRKKKYMYVYYK